MVLIATAPGTSRSRGGVARVARTHEATRTGKLGVETLARDRQEDGHSAQSASAAEGHRRHREDVTLIPRRARPRCVGRSVSARLLTTWSWSALRTSPPSIVYGSPGRRSSATSKSLPLARRDRRRRRRRRRAAPCTGRCAGGASCAACPRARPASRSERDPAGARGWSMTSSQASMQAVHARHSICVAVADVDAGRAHDDAPLAVDAVARARRALLAARLAPLDVVARRRASARRAAPTAGGRTGRAPRRAARGTRRSSRRTAAVIATTHANASGCAEGLWRTIANVLGSEAK